VPKKVEQINDHLFIDTYKSNNIKIGVNNMTVNECFPRTPSAHAQCLAIDGNYSQPEESLILLLLGNIHAP